MNVRESNKVVKEINKEMKEREDIFNKVIKNHKSGVGWVNREMWMNLIRDGGEIYGKK